MKSRSTVPTDGPTDASRDDLAGPTKSAGARRAVATVAATVGAAAAVTTLTAPSADARSPFRYWDRVAHCESGNRWHVNTGNGFYGGLQFTSSTWSAYGGGKYAGRADRASRMEQIQVARRVLHSQGPGAWPVCGPQAGLTRTTGHATAKRLPADADGYTVTHHAKRAHKAKHRSHAHGTNPHHHARHAAHGRYRVQSGDTLAKIARKKHVHGGWHALYRANRDHVHNPSVIHIGQVLRLP